ncbi:MAG: TetR/AcrR family transcriptional regulator [Proteobacteria bacterium]|nr:TetR/AcrR family transcriptional regulator [Pseudomonadota bacterium]
MGTTERRRRERRQRENQIRDAAIKVFQEKGFNHATIEAIAGEAELSVGTIYLYFKNKEELYASLNQRTIEKFDQGLDVIMADGAASPESKLERAWELLFSVFCRSPIYIRALVHGQLQGTLQDISPDLLFALNETAQRIMAKFAGILRQGMDQGSFMRAEPAALADLFWGTFTGVVSWEEAKRTTDPRKAYLEPTLKLAFRVFIQGIQERSRGGRQ